MQLTESDKQVLEQAKKLDARWPKTRWVGLAFGLGMILIGIIHISSFPEASVLLGLGIAQMWLLLKIWKGRQSLKLLLKLAQENEQKPN
ncbi:MAG TPA: hypothetical protein VN765_05270 [Candidatus Acidoferrum sp.]|nr:hypothetical protein [Candidatus Acidoferrum sp.]